MKRTATERGTWPPGIHWTPGETRDIPDDYPADLSNPPAWLPKAEQPAKAKPRKPRKPQE